MAIVRMMIKKTDKPSEEQLQAVRKDSRKPIVFDKDSPEMTAEMLAGFKRVHPKRKSMIN
jgi:hypothetical protein